MGKFKWDLDERLELENHLKNGLTNIQIGHKMNRSRDSIYFHMKKRGFNKYNYRAISNSKVEALIDIKQKIEKLIMEIEDADNKDK